MTSFYKVGDKLRIYYAGWTDVKILAIDNEVHLENLHSNEIIIIPFEEFNKLQILKLTT